LIDWMRINTFSPAAAAAVTALAASLTPVFMILLETL
jgi:hypothetical protein